MPDHRRLPALLALLAVACTGSAGDRGGEGGEPATGVHVYEVRGQVTALPDPADPLSDLRVRHEAVAHFVGIEGEAVGMDSMNMPFPVADGVDLAGLAVGDKVRLTFEVDWQGDVPYRATKIERLPADAELTFGKARPAPAPEATAVREDDPA